MLNKQGIVFREINKDTIIKEILWDWLWDIVVPSLAKI